MHLGALHAYESVLVYALAFGPFLVVGIVVWVLRRRDVRAEQEADADDRTDAPAD
jgi:hypothetical protein